MFEPIYSKKIELKKSPIHGIGAFAKEPISRGEILFVKNGHVLLKTERCFEKTVECDWPVNDQYTIGAKLKSEHDLVRLQINHSCNPNCGLIGINAGIAMRDIAIAEEITFDYAMLDNEDYSFDCNCRNENCRKTIKGFDWENKELQKRYDGYFSNNIQVKINKQNKKTIQNTRISET